MGNITFTLKDANGVEYNFNNTFKLSGLPFRMRINNQKVAFSHGGKDMGDNKIEARDITLRGKIHSNSTSDFESQLTALKAACFKLNQTLYYDSDKYIKIRCVDRFREKPSADGSFLVCSDIEIRFFAEDPFMYKNIETSNFTFLESSGQQFDINNPGNVDVFVVIGMTTRVANNDFTIKNITAGLSFSMQDGNFVEGSTIIFDSINGTVKTNGDNSIRYFNGQFIRMVAGTNTFEYVGATPCGVSIRYTERNL